MRDREQLTVGMTFYKMFLGKISTLIMAGDAQIIKVSARLCGSFRVPFVDK